MTTRMTIAIVKGSSSSRHPLLRRPKKAILIAPVLERPPSRGKMRVRHDGHDLTLLTAAVVATANTIVVQVQTEQEEEDEKRRDAEEEEEEKEEEEEEEEEETEDETDDEEYESEGGGGGGCCWRRALEKLMVVNRGARFVQEVAGVVPPGRKGPDGSPLAFLLALRNCSGVRERREREALDAVRDGCAELIVGGRLTPQFGRRYAYSVFDREALRDMEDAIRETPRVFARLFDFDPELDLLAVLHVESIVNPFGTGTGSQPRQKRHRTAAAAARASGSSSTAIPVEVVAAKRDKKEGVDRATRRERKEDDQDDYDDVDDDDPCELPSLPLLKNKRDATPSTESGAGSSAVATASESPPNDGNEFPRTLYLYVPLHCRLPEIDENDDDDACDLAAAAETAEDTRYNTPVLRRLLEPQRSCQPGRSVVGFLPEVAARSPANFPLRIEVALPAGSQPAAKLLATRRIYRRDESSVATLKERGHAASIERTSDGVYVYRLLSPLRDVVALHRLRDRKSPSSSSSSWEVQWVRPKPPGARQEEEEEEQQQQQQQEQQQQQ